MNLVDMHIEDFSHCDYCRNREECYDETMVVDLCSSFWKDEDAYNAILKRIAENNGERVELVDDRRAC